jgi:fatty-acyl-CoA synthase
VSWLPLYHDMGLIAAFHLPLFSRLTLIQLDPFQWVKVPLLLLEAISREKASLTWIPNFAYNLMACRISDDDMQSIDLSSMRMFINCSEPVRAESHEKFYRKFSRYGVRKETLSACYAMAETTFAATQTEPGREANRLEVDRNALARGMVKMCEDDTPGRVCVSSGKPIQDCSIRIIDENGLDLPEGFVGEIVIKSLSLFDGYRNNQLKTEEVLRDGWYSSGDLGFLFHHEYYIIGRKKDLIIIAGKNVYPEDVEDAVNQVDGVIPGRVIAFGEEDLDAGTEMVSVIVETHQVSAHEKKRLKDDIVRAGMAIDVTIAHIYLMPPRWLIKSSSGKPGRKINKERIARKEAS